MAGPTTETIKRLLAISGNQRVLSDYNARLTATTEPDVRLSPHPVLEHRGHCHRPYHPRGEDNDPDTRTQPIASQARPPHTALARPVRIGRLGLRLQHAASVANTDVSDNTHGARNSRRLLRRGLLSRAAQRSAREPL